MNSGKHRYVFRLYVTGNGSYSLQAIANLSQLCAEHLADCHDIEVVDLTREPERALSDQIFITPTLIKLAPPPQAHVIGSLNNPLELLDLIGLQRNRGS